VDGWMDGWVDRQTDGWMDGETDRQIIDKVDRLCTDGGYF
jgi:hypothetical protein